MYAQDNISASLDYFVTTSPPYLHQFSTISGGNCINYFSRPANMAFHDFTKRQKPHKNLRSLLGLGLKFIPTPSLTNCWSRLKQSSYERLFRSVHLRFHFAGKPPSEGTTTYDPKIYVHSTWTPPHWTIPPIALEERLTRFSSALSKTFQDATRQNKPITSPTSRPTNVTTTTNVSHRSM